jgi:hypothetical protein
MVCFNDCGENGETDLGVKGSIKVVAINASYFL